MNQQTQRLVRVRDFPAWDHGHDLPGGGHVEGRNALLHCASCGAECSANPGDYWDTIGDHAFRCCGRPMRLVRKHTTFEEVAI